VCGLTVILFDDDWHECWAGDGDPEWIDDDEEER
jgi:hypothetical protein